MLRWTAALAAALLLAGCTLSTAPADTSGIISGAPTVRIVSPLPNAAYLVGVPVNIQAQIGNAGADIDRVEIAVDNTLAATLPQPNTSASPAFNIVYTWTATGEGDHIVAVTAYRADGSNSAPQTVTISVRAQGAQPPTDLPTQNTTTNTSGGSQNTQPTNTSQSQPNPLNLAQTQSAAQQAAQTSVQSASQPASQASQPAPQTAASATPNVPTASFTQAINVRRGPGTNFDPPLGTFAVGQTTEILGTNLDGTWLKVRFGSGEGWVYGPLTTITGSIAQLPREAGPATPIPTAVPPPPPTAIPATAVPASNVNLVAGIVVLEPAQPRCGETFVVGFDVANLGSGASPASGTVSLTDARVADGSTQGTTVGGYPVLQPGQTFRVTMPITINTWYNEQHRITLVIDPQNQIPESNDGDNTQTVVYTLDKAGCS
ncbi:MAG: CARDB domain-containing protein [Anaerolineae bacterium]